MHIRLFQALALLAVLAPAVGHAQDAVLVLSPGPTTAVRAGTGKSGFAGDGGDAAAAMLANPSAMAQDAQGNLFIADTRNHRIRSVSPTGTIRTVAGTGIQGFSGDGGPATQAQLDSPSGIAVGADASLYIADTRNHRIRQMDGSGIIRTIAGTGVAGFSGDGPLASAARLSSPQGLSIGSAGELYIADTGNHRVRRIANGTIATVAGNGTQGVSPNGTAATAAQLDSPAAVTIRADGSLLIADRRNNRVSFVSTNGLLSTLDTGGIVLRRPAAIATNSLGDVLVADAGNFRIAQVSGNSSGMVLGSGEQGPVNASQAPAQTALGAPTAIIPGISGAPLEFSTLDRDHGQVVRVTLPHLDFPDTAVATSSAVRTLALRNAGTAALTVSTLSLPSGFSTSPSSTCSALPFILGPATACNLDLVFSPAAEGGSSGLVQVAVSGGAMQRVLVTGNGVRSGTLLPSSTTLQANASISYAGSSLTLTALVLGTSSAQPTGAITFQDGSTEVGRTPLDATGHAALAVASLQAGAHTLYARYSGDNVYQPSLSPGTAISVVAPPDFTLAVNGSARLSLHSGDAASVPLVLQPLQGVLNQTVTLQVDGLPSATTINITPVPIVLSSNPVNVDLAFKLPAHLARKRPSTVVVIALLLPTASLFRRRRLAVLLSTGILFGVTTLQGCGGGYLGNSSVSAQSATPTYPVTVTATCTGVSGQPIVHTATFTVVVQP